MNTATSFVSVTREERFFCAILTHVLLAYPNSSAAILDRFTGKAQEIRLSPTGLEVYTELAALRDAWASLGNHKLYDGVLHAKRLTTLHSILAAQCGYDGTVVDLQSLVERRPDFFLTGGKKPKLKSPALWLLKKSDPLIDGITWNQLLGVQWAFCAKPDMLLLGSGHGVIIEAKVESGFGDKGSTGYGQQRTQSAIAALLPRVMPELFLAPPVCLTLAGAKLDSRRNVTWVEVHDAVDPAEIDPFSYRALARAVALTT